MIGGLITGGLSLLGGLFGRKKKTQETTTRVDYGRMVADATAAGFNPLTAIRNGGSAGFTTTTSPTISNTPEVLSNLGGILGQALGEKLDPINAKKRELDTLLVDRQLRQLKQGPQVPASFKTPRTYAGTKVSQQLVPRLGASSSSKTASVRAAYKPQNTNLKPGDDPQASGLGLDNGRYGWFNPGWFPDAGGAVSQAYGEPGEWIGGALNIGASTLYSLVRNGRSAVEDYGAARKREQARSRGPQPKLPSPRYGGWVGGALRRRQPITGGGGGW